MRTIELPVDKLRQLLDYDSASGVLRWKPRGIGEFNNVRSFKIWHSRYCGKRAGCIYTLNSGYTMRVLYLKPFGRLFEHRVAWCIHTGEQPPSKIDHINLDATDNRWCNLRDGSDSENERNTPMYQNNTSGFTGVSWSKQHEKWEAHVGLYGRKINLGLFDDLIDAATVVKRKREELGFTNIHGEPRLSTM